MRRADGERAVNVAKELVAFFQAGADRGLKVTAATPLLEWGILDSVRIVELADFLEARTGYRLKAAELRRENFKDVRAIARLVGGGKRRAPRRAR